jgi:hypothetical protein
MIKDWLRRFLGITENDARIVQLEEEKRSLEDRVIKSVIAKDLLVRTTKESTFEQGVQVYLNKIGVKHDGDISQKVVVAAKAVQAVEGYGFKRHIRPTDVSIPSPVISFRDLQEHPERYLSRLSKGFMRFPVGLNLDSVNKLLGSHFGNIQISISSVYSSNGTLDFTQESLFGYMTDNKGVGNLLQQSLTHAQLNRKGDCGTWMGLDPVDFLSNYDALEAFVNDQGELDNEQKTRALSALRFAKEVYVSAIEIVGTTRIRDASELLEPTLESTVLDKEEVPQIITLETEFKNKIKKQLLEEPRGTSYEAIQGLLEIGSREKFRELASLRTTEILARDSRYKRLTHNLGKPLEAYSVGESVMLACYFARNIIETYSTLEDAVKSIIGGRDTTKISGKCTDYTGLALHYLREYLIPLHPEKFEDWKFGFDSDVIGSYAHCYMQVLHINSDQTVDVYFLDPTKLASKGLNSLKNIKVLAKAVDTANLPIEIKRYAEDFLTKKIE